MTTLSTDCEYITKLSYWEVVEQGSYVGKAANKIYEVWRMGGRFYSVNHEDDTVVEIPDGFLKYVLGIGNLPG